MSPRAPVISFVAHKFIIILSRSQQRTKASEETAEFRTSGSILCTYQRCCCFGNFSSSSSQPGLQMPMVLVPTVAAKSPNFSADLICFKCSDAFPVETFTVPLLLSILGYMCMRNSRTVQGNYIKNANFHPLLLLR